VYTDDVTFTVVAAANAITNLQIRKYTGVAIDIHYTGTLPAYGTLVFDCAARNVINNGTNDYDNFVIGSNHKIDVWVRILSGQHSLHVIRTGGGGAAHVDIDFRASWA